ncbi:MAG: AAA family ATPase [Gammaproteobacteria bacterium]|nr:AAA family ATPase [Gammaproteobacteria bacterium]
MSERHTEALAHLIYGVRESGGFIQLTGEVGTGKTTLARSLLQQVPDTADVAVILNPQLSRNEFLSAICEELGVPLPESANSLKTLTNALNAYLLRNYGRGRRTILIVDEAQNLRVDVLEQVRLLTNLETTKQKLLQIILIGQPELRDILSRNDMRQLAQRITGRYHLEPLSREETTTYIDHRLKVAGAMAPIFSDAAKRELYRLSKGVPRMVNVIADRAMLGAFTRENHQVTPQILRIAASEVLDQRVRTLSPWYRWSLIGGSIAALAALVFIISWIWAAWPSLAPRLAASIGMDPDPESNPEKIVVTRVNKRVTIGRPPPEISMPDAIANDELIDAESIPEDRLESALAQNANLTNNDKAFENLFGIWGAEYMPGTARACNQAQQYQLYCLFQRGSLAQVRSLDRPAILTLRDADSRQHQVVLSGLNNQVAFILIGDESYDVNMSELTNFWFGEYLLLWRPQSGKVKEYFPGMRDEGIKWLRASLAEIQGKPVMPIDSDVYDAELEARVREYQRDRRLTVDGLVGYRTQITINTDLRNVEEPRLARAD